MYIETPYVYEDDWINKENCFLELFSINVNSVLFGIGLFYSCKIICFEAIQNGCKLSRMFQASTEIRYQILLCEICRRMCDVYED